MTILNNYRLTILLILISAFIIVNNIIHFPGNILSWDVFGYYLYLPMFFIYNDLGISEISIVNGIIDQYQNTSTFYQAVIGAKELYVMKYSIGMSIFYAPFFFIGHFIALLSNFHADGFSLPYQVSIFFGGILYTLLGIWTLARVLLSFFKPLIVGIVLILIVFSTNYLIHMTMYGQNAMSHNYLFTTYSLILWATIHWHRTFKRKYAIILGILCGITILSRPTEIVCLIIPVIWGIKDKESLVSKIKDLYKYKSQIIIFLSILILFGSLQLIYWKLYAGKFLYNSYQGNPGEGMDFNNPYFLEVLFSFRKGWLIYTPIMLLCLPGFVFLYRKNREIFYAVLLYFLSNLYLVSCWSCWWYAQSFSQRALIPSYPVMAVLIGYVIAWLYSKKRLLTIAGTVVIGTILFLNIFQSIQYHKGVISGDRMTRDYYIRTFGKLSVNDDDKELLLIDRSRSDIEPFKNEYNYESRILQSINFEGQTGNDTDHAYLSKSSYRLDSLNIFSPAIEASYNEITSQLHAWIRVTVYVYPVFPIDQNPFSLVVHFTHNGSAYKYRAYDSENMQLSLNEWNKISLDYLTPEVRRKTDNLKVYLWLRGKEPVYLDNLEVVIFEKKLQKSGQEKK